MSEFVQRPISSRASRYRIAPPEGLLETAQNGKAIVVPLKGTDRTALQAVLRNWLKRQGHRLHYLHDPATNALVCWAEPIPGGVRARRKRPLGTPPEEA